VVGWVILRGLEEGVTWALIGGLSLDLTSGAPFGIFSLSLLLVVLITHVAHGRVFGSSTFLPLSLTFPLTLFFNGLALFSLNVLGRPINWSDAFTHVLIPLAVLNTGVMLLVFPPLYFLNRWLNPQPLSF
jgi:rod shape-determining protein MreD